MMIDDQNVVPADIPSEPLETIPCYNNPQATFLSVQHSFATQKIARTPAPTSPIPQTSPKDGCISAMDVSLT